MKNLILVASLLMTTFSFSQTINNFKVEHNPSSLNVKVHVVNTSDFYFSDNINNLTLLDGVDKIFQFQLMDGQNGSAQLLSPAFGTVGMVNQNRNQLNDTVLTISLLNVQNQVTKSNYNSRIYFEVNSSSFDLQLSPVTFTNFLLSNHYTPCYTTVGPDVNKPTVFWESISDNMISHYIVKRNGTEIATVPFSTGILSYTDLTNTESSNFVQEYTIVAVDSSNNQRSGNVSTIHARNLSSVDGKIEMDWTVPKTAKSITNYNIYELNGVDLVLVTTLPSTVTQYTVLNPKTNSSYLVGIESMDCTGTSKLKSLTGTLLSNKVTTKSTASLTDVSLSSDDEVTGYFDTLGRPVDPKTAKGLIITLYKSGKTEKVIY